VEFIALNVQICNILYLLITDWMGNLNSSNLLPVIGSFNKYRSETPLNVL